MSTKTIRETARRIAEKMIRRGHSYDTEILSPKHGDAGVEVGTPARRCPYFVVRRKGVVSGEEHCDVVLYRLDRTRDQIDALRCTTLTIEGPLTVDRLEEAMVSLLTSMSYEQVREALEGLG